MATLITATKDGERTRIWIGCDDMAAEPVARLRANGYAVKSRRSSIPPARDAAEKDRADRIMIMMFAH